jgi:hypothetical protein
VTKLQERTVVEFVIGDGVVLKSADEMKPFDIAKKRNLQTSDNVQPKRYRDEAKILVHLRNESI